MTVTPLGGNPASRAIFTGTALAFQSGDLLSDSGELTRRKLNVSLRNNTREVVGASGGFKVMFGAFSTGLNSDLRADTVVSTVVGSGASGSADGPALGASLSSPHSVLWDNRDNSIFFSGYNQSLRVSRNGFVSTLITSIGPVTSMVWRNGQPNDIIYAASLNTHKIYKLDLSTNTAILLAGTGTSGADDGPGATARFNLPYSVAQIPNTDSTNPDLLVSEGTTGKLRRLTWTGSSYNVSTLPFTNDAPRGMISLGNGKFAVSEAFIRKVSIFDLSGNKISIGDGNSGSDNGNGTQVSFFEPIGLLYDGKAIYVSESNGLIRQLTLQPSGNMLFAEAWQSSTIAGVDQGYGFADGPGDQAKFLGPVCMAMDTNGSILVADSGNSRIRKVTPDSGRFPIFNGDGGASSGVDSVRLANPTDFVPTDGGPTPYILENKTVQPSSSSELTPWSLIIPAGVKSFDFVVTIEAQTDSAAPPDAVFNAGPNPAPGSARAIVRTLTGATSAGYSNGNVSGALFASPGAFAYDAQGVLYVADSVNRSVRRITSSGTVSTIAGVVPGKSGVADGLGSVATFGSVNGIAVSASGSELYVTDGFNNRIRRIARVGDLDPAQPFNWKVSTIAGTGAADYANGPGWQSKFNKPWGIVLTSGGELLVSEAAGNRIRRLTPTAQDLSLSTSWTVSLVAGDDSSGTPTGATTDGSGNSARFGEPRGITLAASGELYVADFGNHLVRKMTSAGVVTTFAGNGIGYGDSDTGASALFSSPTDVAVDRAGYVYVADSGNYLIRRISPAGSVRTVAGFGVAGTADGPGNVARFSVMNGIELNSAGDVIVGDASRVRLVQRLISSSG
ncbi:Ig family protein [Fimbriimonas ginsengisoli Gsoil 348]|uniref:Ig family protein n=1 Tax=Fimbriimonas ginsengisoli Gsoil 348 TaxID=661478 RepID=A0A068NT48_FIMGI|nr:Ig family protein [Fimbriimonas ginsengisoli Gsoil 348]